jgi:O-antigen ligase
VQPARLEAPREGRTHARIDAWCEWAILALVIFVLVWSPLALACTRPLGFLVIQGATAVAMVLWAVRMWTQRPFRLLWPPICWAVLAFALYALARCPLVPVEYVGRQQLIRVLVYAAWFMIVLGNLTRRESAAIVSITLIAVGVGVSFFAIYQFATQYPLIWGESRPEQYLLRGSGTFINPNNMAAFLGMVVPLALSCTILSRFSITFKVVLAYCTVAMLTGIVVSGSRGGILTAGVTLVLFCIFLVSQRESWLPAVVLGVLLLALGMWITTQFDSVQRRFDKAIQNDKLWDDRLYYWTAASKLYSSNVVWGIGPGHFDVEYPSVRINLVQVRPQYVHNDYLNALCEWGAAGVAIIAAASGLMYYGALKVWRAVRRDRHDFRSQTSDRAAFIVGATTALIGLMLHCVVDFHMQIPADALTAIALMALLASQWRFATERYWNNPGRYGKLILTGLAAALAGYLVVAGIQRGVESWWLWQAQNHRANLRQAVADLEKAHQADPTNADTDLALGEMNYLISLEGNRDYQKYGQDALGWYGKALELNPFDPEAPLRCGMCLDWLDQPNRASPYFNLAESRDPNNAYLAIEMGRHYAALKDFKAAEDWFQKSMRLWFTLYALDEWASLKRQTEDPFASAPK